MEHDSNAERKGSGVGLYHYAILLPTRKDLANFLIHLIDTKYPISGASDHHFSEAIYFNDPERNGIEIYADRPREYWQRSEEGYLHAPTTPLDVNNLLSEIDGTSLWKGMPEDTVIGHFHLHASNLEESEKFYDDILGFDINFDETMRSLFRGQFVSAGGYHHHIGFNLWKGNNAPKMDQTKLGLTYYTIVLPNELEMGKVRSVLVDAKINLNHLEQGFKVDDPLGIGIVFTKSL